MDGWLGVGGGWVGIIGIKAISVQSIKIELGLTGTELGKNSILLGSFQVFHQHKLPYTWEKIGLGLPKIFTILFFN